MMLPNKSLRRRGFRSLIGLCVLCTVGLLALYSCSSKQQVLLRSDGSGSVQFRVTIGKILMNAANGLSQGGSGSASAGEFDIPKIKEVFSKNKALKLESLTSPSSGVLAGSFTFNDIGKLFHGSSNGQPSDIVTFTQTASGNLLKVHITRANFAQIAELAGMTDNPMYLMFGPEQNAATSVDDLNQMMVYVLGESGPAALKSSAIDVQVNVDGKVISQTGGTLSGNTVHFHIPLVRLLLLATPLDFSVAFS
jgi:hypothetical protein